jgi:hypothetical protein
MQHAGSAQSSRAGTTATWGRFPAIHDWETKVMNKTKLLAGTAVALLLCAAPALAQQEKRGEEVQKGTQAGSGSQAKEQSAPRGGEAQRTERGTRSTQGSSERTPSQRSTQSQPEQGTKAQGRKTQTESERTTQTQSERAKQETGSQAQKHGSKKAEMPSEKTPSEKQGAKQSASEKQGTKQSTTKETQTRSGREGTTAKSGQPNAERSGETPQAGQGARERQSAQGANREGTTGRTSAQGGMRLSEDQRTRVHQTILRERNVNRARDVNISIGIGSRLPRSVRLAVLPQAIISLAPDYRRDRYVVVGEDIVIVDPATYEIVDVIAPMSQTARVDTPAPRGGLTLTEHEKTLVLDNVEMDRGSTLALGSLTEGSRVPRGVELRPFPDTVVREVPKLSGYAYFTAEDRVAIVDPRKERVELVLEERR